AAAASFGAEDRLHIVVAGGPPNVTALAPLAGDRNGQARLELVGVNDLYEAMDFLYATPSALAVLTQTLGGCGGPVFLGRLPAQSAVIEAMRRSYRGRGVVIGRSAPGCPWLPLDDRWAQPEAQFAADRRGDLRRARRLAEKMGRVEFDVSRP